MGDLSYPVFMILLRPKPHLEKYVLDFLSEEGEAFMRSLWEGFPMLDPLRYRGPCRDRLRNEYWAFGTPEWKAFEEAGLDTAILSMQDVLGNETDEANWGLFPDTATSRKVHSCLRDPDRYEIIQIRQDAFQPGEHTLGFDVCEFGGDFTSLICDTVIAPKWQHGVEPFEVAPRLENVNEHVLFRTPEEADAYGSFCMAEPWICPGEYVPIQVDAVPLASDL